MKLPLTLLATVIALAAAGCGGGTVIDSEAAQEDILAGLGARDITVESVDCPGDVDTEEGATYECVVQTQRGEFRVIYRQLDADGTVSQPRLERISGASGAP